MTAEIHIGHCRIDARPAPGSGLSWADAEAHRAFAARVQALVLSILDELLAPHLAGLDAVAVPQAMALELELDANDLRGAAPLARSHLRDRARDAIIAALARGAPPQQAMPESIAVRPSPSSAEADARLLDLLLGWHAGRQLEYRLALLSDPVLAKLLQAVLAELEDPRAVAPAGNPSPSPPRSPDLAIGTATDGKGRGGTTPRRALLALVAAAADEPRSSPKAQLRLRRAIAAARLAVRRAEAGGTDAAEPRDAIPGAEGPEPISAPELPTSTSTPARRGPPVEDLSAIGGAEAPPATLPGRSATPPLAEGRHDLASALPFLALQPLARHGVLDALANGGGSAARLAFAVALRCQALPAAEGWWSAAQLADAAALGGFAEPPDGAALRITARGAGELGELAAASVTAALIAGHRPGLPLPLLADEGRLVVFESEGLYPLCRLDGARLAKAFAGRDDIFFLPSPTARLLGAVDAAGLAGAAPGAPARGEPWRRAAARGWRGMTNMAPGRLAASGARLANAERSARRAAEVWQALTVARPLFAPAAAEADALDFDRTAALLAGFALADLAWTMFGRDPAAWAEPDPLLAIERFADLSGTLEVRADEIVVRLPLGARFADLRDAGLLAPIAGLPWWPGRILAFRGG